MCKNSHFNNMLFFRKYSLIERQKMLIFPIEERLPPPTKCTFSVVRQTEKFAQLNKQHETNAAAGNPSNPFFIDD